MDGMRTFNVYCCVTVEAESEEDAREQVRMNTIDLDDIQDVVELTLHDGVWCESTGTP